MRARSQSHAACRCEEKTPKRATFAYSQNFFCKGAAGLGGRTPPCFTLLNTLEPAWMLASSLIYSVESARTLTIAGFQPVLLCWRAQNAHYLSVNTVTCCNRLATNAGITQQSREAVVKCVV